MMMMMTMMIITSGLGIDCSFWVSDPINCFGWWWSSGDDNDYSGGGDDDNDDVDFHDDDIR